MSTRSCRFFLAGNCRNGADCRFYHEGFSSLPREELFGSLSSSPERHYEIESRIATRSSSARAPTTEESVNPSSTSTRTPSAAHSSANVGTTHSSSSSDPPAYAAARPCRWYMAGYCLRGDSCWFSHDRAVANTTQSRRDIVVLSDDDEVAVDSGGIEAPTSGTASSPSVRETADEEDQRCAICFEVPTTFGLLVSCNHAFCLTCIRTWRSKDISSDPYEANNRSNSVTKACPNCRTPSLYIVPSSFFPTCDDQKQIIIQNYKEAAGRTRCKYFQDSGTRRWCPFGDRCFFAHLNENGEPCRVNQDSDPRRRRRRQGAFESLSETLTYMRDSLSRPRGRRSNDQGMDLAELRDLFIQLARVREIQRTLESPPASTTRDTSTTDSAEVNSWDSQVVGVISDLYAPSYGWGDEAELDLEDDFGDSYYHDLDDIDDLDDADDIDDYDEYLDEEHSYRFWSDHDHATSSP